MNVFERYLDDFNNAVDLTDFLINFILAAVLCLLLRWFYIRHAKSISNRLRFANNFLPLGLTTMLVITIVKSSIALSLGLVGALSIVRFRAAIKDPEELTYLFLAIAIGLAAGATQPVTVIIAFVGILLIVYLTKRMSGIKHSSANGGMYLNIQTDVDDLPKITALLSQHFEQVEFKRMDKLEKGMALNFVVQTDNIAAVGHAQKALSELSPSTTFSILDQPEVWA